MFVLKREVLSTTLILVEGTFCTDRRIAQGASDCVRIYTRHACRAAEHFDARGSRRLLVACGIGRQHISVQMRPSLPMQPQNAMQCYTPARRNAEHIVTHVLFENASRDTFDSLPMQRATRFRRERAKRSSALCKLVAVTS